MSRTPTRTRGRRVGRRQVLQGFGGLGLATVFASACRSGSSDATTSVTSEPTSAANATAFGTSVSIGGESAVTTMPVGSNPFDDYQYENSSTGTQVRIWVAGNTRHIEANGLPDHATGEFPNANNPNAISAQAYAFEVPAAPTQTGASKANGILDMFGMAINGVPFDPGAAEFWNNDPSSGWQLEPMSGAVDLGEDSSNAHVQPTGGYHYHGIPEGLVADAGESHSPLVGFAADGFPVYARNGYADPSNPSSGITTLRSSYRVREGTRPDGPGGAFDGQYVGDYEWVPGLGDLDVNNGRVGVTPEYPAGTYYYVLTDGFPFIPRSFAGTPDGGFARNVDLSTLPARGAGAGRPPAR